MQRTDKDKELFDTIKRRKMAYFEYSRKGNKNMIFLVVTRWKFADNGILAGEVTND